MDAKELNGLFKNIWARNARVSEFDRVLASPVSFSKWMLTFHKKSAAMAEIRADLKAYMDDLVGYFERTEDIPEEIYESLFDNVLEMYRANNMDVFFFEPLMSMLMEHLEEKEQKQKLFLIWSITGFMYLEMSRMGMVEDAQRAALYFEKIIAHRYDTDYVSDLISVRHVIGAYSNIIGALVSLDRYPIDKACRMFDEYVFFKESEIYRSNADDWFLQQCDIRMRVEFPALAYNIIRRRNVPDPDIPKLMKRLSRYMHEYVDGIGGIEKLAEVCDPSASAYYEILLIYANEGDMSWDEAWNRMDAFYREHMLTLEEIFEAGYDPLCCIGNPPQCLIPAVSHSEVSDRVKRNFTKEYLDTMIGYLGSYPVDMDPRSVSSLYRELALNSDIVGAFTTYDERKNFVFTMTILRQLNIHLHSKMVYGLIEFLAMAMIEQQPSLLIGALGCASEEEVRRRRSEILEFCGEAAMFHDIGKCAYTSIIGVEHRNLTGHEFEILRRHPQGGLMFLDVVPELGKYRDIVLGHHKSYDGKFGYPDNFDNTASPDKVIIDLITICDCLDAATDQLGRTYRKPKTFEHVLDEFKVGAGTMYNPDMISFITEHPIVMKSLKKMVTDDRGRLYYDVYQNYFASKNEF